MSIADTVQRSQYTYRSTFDSLRLRASMCDLYFRQQFQKNYYVEELSLIREQNQLIQKIKDNMSNKRISISVCQQDRETTRDAETSQLSQVRSAKALPRLASPVLGSPTNSCVSSKTAFFRRGPAADSSGFTELAAEIERNCSANARQLLDRLMRRSEECVRENVRLKAQLAKAAQEIEAVRLREVAAEAKLYDAHKRLQSCEAQTAEMRIKREEYVAKLTEIELKQIELNKFEIACMVREKTAKASAASLNDWVTLSQLKTRSIQNYRSELLKLKNSIEQVMANPDAYNYRKLAETIVRSLENQETELDRQSQVITRLERKIEGMLRTLKKEP